MRHALLICLVAVTGCAVYPDNLPSSGAVLAGTPPALLPLDQVLAGAEPIAEVAGDALAARAAALKARADNL